MEKFSRFSRILAGLAGQKISPLENKKRSKNKKNVKKSRFLLKNYKKRKKTFFTSMIWRKLKMLTLTLFHLSATSLWCTGQWTFFIDAHGRIPKHNIA